MHADPAQPWTEHILEVEISPQDNIVEEKLISE